MIALVYHIQARLLTEPLSGCEMARLNQGNNQNIHFSEDMGAQRFFICYRWK
jgi:hypothetical protein